MQFISAAVQACLKRFEHSGQVFVAYSGGMDSHVLLHCCAAMPELKTRLNAVYIHHGLQQVADSWIEHCARQCAEMGVSYQYLRVDARPRNGQSPEEAAREARYQALKPLLKQHDILLTGQHREDQAETILLQLFRGSGLAGLSGMPLSSGFGEGYLVRPLLDVARQDIKAYAQLHNLSWVEDPSNQEMDFDRNYLRNELMPLIKQRWPAVDKTVSRAGRHCAETQHFLTHYHTQQLQVIFKQTDGSLCIDKLLQHDEFTQRQLIRAWFAALGLQMPSVNRLQQIMQHVLHARADSEPKLLAKKYQIRRYRNFLYCLPRDADFDVQAEYIWADYRTPLVLPGNGMIYSKPGEQGGIARSVLAEASKTVRYRSGGELIRLAGRQGQHSLKKLFQEIALPPWLRSKIPLLYLDEQLAAVGDLWISVQFQALDDTENILIAWQQENLVAKLHDEKGGVY